MPKLAKNMYTTAKGERKINCYIIHISKEMIKKTDIKDKYKAYVRDGKIIIEKED